MLDFSISRDIEEFPCPDNPPCRFVHRRITDTERYYLNGKEVTQAELLAVTTPLGFNLAPDAAGFLRWSEPAIREVKDG